ncbi:hypothetical protein [Bdellovibrio bacteriovorus]|uniref:hypothetical protein n=1 Tax=Bdellovibrio bacteriovorus TaxID=959 RepID=UPI0035A6B7F9
MKWLSKTFTAIMLIALTAFVGLSATSSKLAHAQESVVSEAQKVAPQVSAQSETAPNLAEPGFNTSEPTPEEWTGLFSRIGTAQGAGTAGIALLILQALLLIARAPFTKLSATAKWWAVGILSCLVALGVEVVKTPVFSWQVLVQGLLSAPFIAAFSILIHQGVKLNINEKA